MQTILLFDLDNTLIGNPTGKFVPAYLKALGQHTKHLPGGSQLIDALLAATRLVVATDHPDRTNEEVVWAYLEEALGIDRISAEPTFNDFYANAYRDLEPLTTRYPISRDLMTACFERNYRVVIATNPIYPRVAIEERLRWGGIPISDFDYALVTHYENMHASKPAVAYYEDILRQIDASPQDCLMIGDDWKNDIEPAGELGMATWWLPPTEDSELPDRRIGTKMGSLELLMEQLPVL